MGSPVVEFSSDWSCASVNAPPLSCGGADGTVQSVANQGDSSFSARWRELAIDPTIHIALDATIRPATAVTAPARPQHRTVPDPPGRDLPIISMASGGTASSPSLGGGGPDLALGERLGAGGMGQVLLATQRSLQREVAVKVLREEADSSLADALIAEAVLTGSLAHPGVIPVHALGIDTNGRPVLVMKRIQGASWSDLIHDPEDPAWPAWESRAANRLLVHLEILSQVCDAVEFAHSRGVVHRDIKPENVMLGSFGEVYLVDWGVATEMRDGAPCRQLAGTPSYMAPEMASGGAVDARTDVYLLGATLHEVLTGEHRHTGDSLRAVLEAAFSSRRVTYSDDVPSQLAALCNAATARDPADRPADAAAFRAALGEYLRHRSSVALCTAAQARLDELQQMLAHGERISAEVLAVEAGALAAEARFGFSQALDEWNENVPAARGLQDCLVAQTEIHLARRDGDSARAVLDSMDDPPAQLRERVGALAAEREAEAKERARLESLGREHDASVGVRGRLLAALALLGASLGVTAFAHLQEGGTAALTHAQASAFAAVVLSAGVAVLWFKRKELLANAFNRRGAALVVAAMLVLNLERAIAWVLDVPMQHMFLADVLILMTASAAGAILLLQWVGWMTGVFAATALTIALAPARFAADVFSAGATLALLIAVVFWRRTQ